MTFSDAFRSCFKRSLVSSTAFLSAFCFCVSSSVLDGSSFRSLLTSLSADLVVLNCLSTPFSELTSLSVLPSISIVMPLILPVAMALTSFKTYQNPLVSPHNRKSPRHYCSLPSCRSACQHQAGPCPRWICPSERSGAGRLRDSGVFLLVAVFFSGRSADCCPQVQLEDVLSRQRDVERAELSQPVDHVSL